MNYNGKTALVDVEFGDEIVISGIAGRFPKSDNIKLLQQNLFDKVYLGTNTDEAGRWQYDHPDIPKCIGTCNNIKKFDAEYFDISHNQAHAMDPSTRCLLEHTYEAIVDAGVNPKNLRGTKTGMIVATCHSESAAQMFGQMQLSDVGILGYCKTMQANWISHWLGINGPSLIIDSGCSSSLYAIETAYRIIQSGQCDDMIVAGSNILLHPYVILQFAQLGVLAYDGICRPFDEDAQGFMRSETIAVVYLQKAKNAKRIYGILIYAKTNSDGYKKEGITSPSNEMQMRLVQDFYDECNVSPSCVNYIESHGTGTKVGDPQEIKAIEKIFCKHRPNPLLIGSVKSNLGHTEPAAGICQIAKVLIAMETGIIPPNLNFTKARNDIEAFKRKTIRVITAPTLWEPSLVGINSFGFGGANAHILLAPNMKKKVNNGAPKDDLPRLVMLSGRTEEAVKSFLHEIECQPVDAEYIRLLHGLFAEEMQGHPYRGYTIVEHATPGNAINEVDDYSKGRKPICFVFSGIGSQWPGMGKSLLQFPAFFKTVEKCDTILKDFGVHIIDILTSKEDTIFHSILNAVVGVSVMQIGLIDLLTSINITPDYVLGYSFGELCCGYVSGDFTVEQVILSAYHIGLVLEETKIMGYHVMDIGLNYKKVKKICPADIKIISSYSTNICSISGPTKSMQAFTKELEINEVFYKEINCCNIPLHTCYLAPTKYKILNYLSLIIPQKMKHSHIWRGLSCDTNLSYAEYFANNLINPIFFEKGAKAIPESTAFVEIAPDGILQNVLKGLFNTTIIALAQRDHENNMKVFLQGLGKMYNCGTQPQVFNLYPTVEFPVSRGTPMISPSIKWNHSEDWYVASYIETEKMISRERIVNISLKDSYYKYLKGHVIDGRYVLPATGYIFLIWETICMLHGKRNVPVVIEDVKFFRATLVPRQENIKLIIMVQKASGTFEIIEESTVVVTGRVRIPSDPHKEKIPSHDILEDDEEEIMTTRDIYKELKLRGYQYTSPFRGIISSSTTGSRGHIAWLNNWTAFMDNMLQMKIIGTATRSLHIPMCIQKFLIDPYLHAQQLRNITTKNKHLPVRVYKHLDTVISGGVEINGIATTSIHRRKKTECPVIEEHRFVAHRDRAITSFEEAIILSIHLVLECHHVTKVDIIELVEDSDEISMKLASPLFDEILNNTPSITQHNINLMMSENSIKKKKFSPNIEISQSKTLSKNNKTILVAGCNLLMNSKRETLKEILEALQSDGFLLTRGRSLTEEDIVTAKSYDLVVVLEKHTGDEYITLLKKRGQSTSKMEVIRVNNYEFSWLEQLKSILNAESQLTNTTRIVVVGEKDTECGILGLVNCLRKEPGGKLIRGVFIQDENAPKFSLYDPFYAKQLQIDLVINILRPGKVWGSYRHLPLPSLKPTLVYHAVVNQMVHADLSSIRWMEGAINPNCKHENLINIIYAALNFKDLMIATGKMNVDNFMSCKRLEKYSLGVEFAGIDNAGRKIMGYGVNRCISNKQLVDKYLSWEVPDEWTLEDAATVPVAYTTCYYAMYLYGKLKNGDKILIHSGTGAVGQAAIHIALHHDCEIFTTVGTAKKRQFIRDNFPLIPDDHIGYSHDTSFEQMIYQQTNGRGVDIILNSLAEDKLLASIRCLAKGGRFLEIGKFDMFANNILDASVFSRGIQFYSIMLDNTFITNNEQKQYIKTVLATGIDNGVVKPIVRTVFQKDEVEAAFRYMAVGKHIGKIIIKVQEEDISMGTPLLALPRYYCLPNRSYIILGGLGGFGMELADWLVIRGAKNLVLISRTGIKNGYQRMKIEQWESYGVKVLNLSNVDVSDIKDCENILKTAEDVAPIDAIFNLAIVLSGKICSNHTVETFQEPFKGKAWATKNLDQLSRKICPQLRHFVVFSSISCGRGLGGESNYGMANSIMERICENRSQLGLHGLAIQWGAIGDVGILADMQDDDKEVVVCGTLQQKINCCIQKLEEFLLQKSPVVASMVLPKKSSDAVNEISMVNAVATIMGLKDLSTISRHVRLPELGMDSMIAVEVKQSLEREYGIFLSPQDIRNLTFAKLGQMSDEKHENEQMLSSSTALNANDLNGLQLLIRSIGKENIISDVCVNLPTEANSAKDEIFFLPGIEGCEHIFRSLAPRIKAPAICLQYGAYNIGNSYHTISEIADCMLKHIVDKIKSKKEFIIVAYSYGSVIGIELVKKLEEMDFRGRLVLVDGAPEMVKALVKLHIPYTTTSELQDKIFLHLMDIVEPAASKKLLVELNKYNNWDDKLNTFINHLPSAYEEILDNSIRPLCMTMYNNFRAIYEYDTTQIPKIVTPIILLKPTLQSLRLPDEDYGLHKITTGNVQVHLVEGDHITMLHNDKVITIINGEQMESDCN